MVKRTDVRVNWSFEELWEDYVVTYVINPHKLKKGRFGNWKQIVW